MVVSLNLVVYKGGIKVVVIVIFGIIFFFFFVDKVIILVKLLYKVISILYIVGEVCVSNFDCILFNGVSEK